VVHLAGFSQGAFFVNVVARIFFYMRVSNHHESPPLLLNLLVHSVHLLVGEPSRVKREILVVIGVVYIHPQNINLEFVQCKISVTLNYSFRSKLFLPLTKVETKAVSRRHFYVAS
jgi:hypothetical protein